MYLSLSLALALSLSQTLNPNSATYVTTFIDKLVNWDFVSANFAKAK